MNGGRAEQPQRRSGADLGAPQAPDLGGSGPRGDAASDSGDRLPPLDSVKNCPACGYETGYNPALGYTPTRFCQRDCHQWDLNVSGMPEPAYRVGFPKPHHHRTCARCGFEWLEATILDRKDGDA